ncbi:HEAT repeat-containing protein 6-like [Acanthaster planci]|uniref:HEAT repeat-containing protein 6 n=1 Tax=Acanthaster planci TaxID=133434 RepID=A0A8B7ZSA1_ACAPL|nr:HEAT repeat-containing protein 6-like [Acanthaster planci]
MASAYMDFAMEERQRYRHCAARLLGMVLEAGEKQKNELNSLLDELNSLAYSVKGLVEQEPGRLLCQACTLVPLQEELLVTKVCQLIVIITHQKVSLSQATVETLLEYVTAAVRQCQPWILPEALRALGAVVYENGPKCSQFLKHLLGTNPQGLLLKLISSTEDDVKRAAVQCIGNLCMRDESGDVIDSEYLQTSYNQMLRVLQSPKAQSTDDYSHFRLLLSTLRGLQNVLAVCKDVHSDQLGVILAALKSYMLYGLPGVGTSFIIPQTLYPSPLYQVDSGPSPSKPTDSTPRKPPPKGDSSGVSSSGATPRRPHQQEKPEKSQELDGELAKERAVEEEISLRPGGGGGGGLLPFTQPRPQPGKKGKKKGKGRQEKEKVPTPRKGRDIGRYGSSQRVEPSSACIPETGRNSNAQSSYNVDPSALFPAWGRVSSSESEYSDTEGGQASKLRSAASKVRQAALTCLHCIIKNTEKKHIFGYWSAFIPDTPSASGSSQSFSLFTSMLKDPAPKARVGSVVVLAALVDGSKQFLAAADDSDLKHAAFTPFSHTLASTIKEIHRCLILALMAESFSTTLTQIIKCLSILVQNVPYHKLAPGLLTKIVKGIKPYFTHRDNNVRTACLTCMGAALSNSAPLPEVTALLQLPDFLGTLAVQPSGSASQTGINAPSWRTPGGGEKTLEGYESPRDEDYQDNESWRRKQDEDSEEEDARIGEDAQAVGKPPASFGHHRETLKSDQQGQPVCDVELTAGTLDTPCRASISGQKPLSTAAPLDTFKALTIHSDERTPGCSRDQSSEQQGGGLNHHPPRGQLEGASASGLGGTGDPSTKQPCRDGNLAPQNLLEDASVSWLVKWCTDAILKDSTENPGPISAELCRLQTPNEALPVRLEALQVMTQLVKGYFPIVRDILDHICTIVVSCLGEVDSSVQLHGLKVLEELGKAMLSQLSPELESPTSQLAVPLSPEEVVLLWDRLLIGPLPAILQNSANSVLQSSACYCLSTIGSQCFELLKMGKQVLCITLLLGLTNEEDYRVKAAAVRALGAYVLYPCLREDVMFVADTANAILTCLEDPSVNVRIRAAWSIGNLSDALIANKDAGDSTFLEGFSDMLLQKLFTAAITGASDHDKVKSNAVRALGMLVRFARPQALAKSSIQTVVTDAIKALLKNITTAAAIRVKVRWNACYAMSNVFKNTHLELGTAPWSTEVFTALTDVVRDCKNFKVRINAALALSIPTCRRCYGNTDRFCLVWSSIVHALEVIDQVADVSELKYKDTLRDQLCQTLTHLGGLLSQEDLSPLHKLLKDGSDLLEVHISRYREAKLTSAEDRRGEMLSATSIYLQDMMNVKDVTAEDRHCAAQLVKIFAEP